MDEKRENNKRVYACSRAEALAVTLARNRQRREREKLKKRRNRAYKGYSYEYGRNPDDYRFRYGHKGSNYRRSPYLITDNRRLITDSKAVITDTGLLTYDSSYSGGDALVSGQLPAIRSPDTSNPVSRYVQRKKIKRAYTAAWRNKINSRAIGTGVTELAPASYGGVSGSLRGFISGALSVVKKSAARWVVPAAGVILFVAFISSVLFSCSSGVNSSGGYLLQTTYTAEDEDILGADEDYEALEENLRFTWPDGELQAAVESAWPDMDEYVYNICEINHDPYELASLLTVLYEKYTRAEVQEMLGRVFGAQYRPDVPGELGGDVVEEVVEIRTRIVTDADGNTHEEEYEWHKLIVTLKNTSIGTLVGEGRFDLTDEQLERYGIYVETQGNRPDLFGGDTAFSVPGESDVEYEIPAEALTDEKFNNMITEARKHLGKPYVWGASGPSSFDCSGFVSYVINHCGNGWNVGRRTAEGLRSCCDLFTDKSQARPGDLIFFQGTYNTRGASHVGIYVGNGMMIHCGKPVQFASIETDWWRSHYFCMGRLA